jgi:hypothetical protein
MKSITDINQINIKTMEGILLFQALAILTTRNYTDKTPWEVLALLEQKSRDCWPEYFIETPSSPIDAAPSPEQNEVSGEGWTDEIERDWAIMRFAEWCGEEGYEYQAIGLWKDKGDGTLHTSNELLKEKRRQEGAEQ